MNLGNAGLLITFGLGVGALWIATSRFRMKLDNNWPLFFYFILVLHALKNDQLLDPYVLYVAVVCGLLLRFEFLNARLVFMVRIIEVALLAYIAFRLLNVVFARF